jgi:RNA polymerase sigma-70 factor (ECF subfamily)
MLEGMFRAVARAGGAAAPSNDARTAAEAALNDLARAGLGGDQLALRDFLRGVAPIVRRICRGIMGRDHSELEDAIQDCLVDVARALPQFRFESSVTHYVTKIAMRRAIASRQRARDRSKQHAALDPSALPMASAEAMPDARSNLVRSLLEDLNEDQATALLLRVMLGHSIEEIASITGVSVNTVKTRLRLGKNQLRYWLERKGERRRGNG